MLGSQDPCVTGTGPKDDVDFDTDEFGRQLWEEGYVPFHVAVLHDDVLPLHVTQLTQALLQGFVAVLLPEILRTPGEKPDAIDFPRLLRYGWNAQSQEQSAQRQANDFCTHWLLSRVLLPHAWCLLPAVI